MENPLSAEAEEQKTDEETAKATDEPFSENEAEEIAPEVEPVKKEYVFPPIELLGKEPSFNEGGPTDAAFPICNGIPAVCLGSGDVETNSHSAENERFPIDGMWRGPQAAFLLAILCSGIDGKVESIL